MFKDVMMFLVIINTWNMHTSFFKVKWVNEDKISESGNEMEETVVKQWGSEDLCVAKRKQVVRHVQNKGYSYRLKPTLNEVNACESIVHVGF